MISQNSLEKQGAKLCWFTSAVINSEVSRLIYHIRTNIFLKLLILKRLIILTEDIPEAMIGMMFKGVQKNIQIYLHTTSTCTLLKGIRDANLCIFLVIS